MTKTQNEGGTPATYSITVNHRKSILCGSAVTQAWHSDPYTRLARHRMGRQWGVAVNHTGHLVCSD